MQDLVVVVQAYLVIVFRAEGELRQTEEQQSCPL